jgi:hypothetical protein
MRRGIVYSRITGRHICGPQGSDQSTVFRNNPTRSARFALDSLQDSNVLWVPRPCRSSPNAPTVHIVPLSTFRPCWMAVGHWLSGSVFGFRMDSTSSGKVGRKIPQPPIRRRTIFLRNTPPSSDVPGIQTQPGSIHTMPCGPIRRHHAQSRKTASGSILRF